MIPKENVYIKYNLTFGDQITDKEKKYSSYYINTLMVLDYRMKHIHSKQYII